MATRHKKLSNTTKLFIVIAIALAFIIISGGFPSETAQFAAFSKKIGIALPSVLSPKIVQTIPPDKYVGVAIDTTITIKFNMPMDKAATEKAVSIYPAHSWAIICWASNDTTATFKLAGWLQNRKEYSVIINTSARGANGVNMSQGYFFDFSTGSQMPLPAPWEKPHCP